MKKLLSVITLVAMLLSFSVSAFATEALFAQPTSYDATMEYYTEINKPLDIIDCFTGLMATDNLTEIDVQYLVESILKSKTTVDVKADMDLETLKQAKIEMKINFNIPAHISEDIKLNGDLTAYLWMDLDLRSAENAKYLIVFKNPLNGKYLYLNLFDEATLGKEQVDEMKKAMIESTLNINTKEYMDEATKLTADAYLKNATVKEEGNTVTLTYTNNALVDGVFDLVEGVFNMETLKASMEAAGMTIDTTQFAQIRALVKGLGIFGENDAATINYTKDASGNIKTIEEKLHLSFNVVELCQVLGMAEEDLYPIEKSKADIDLTLIAKADYKAFNKDVVITMPTLTAENSIDLVTLLMMNIVQESTPVEEVVEEEYIPEYFYNWAKGVMRRSMYACVDDFASSAQWDEDNLKMEYKKVTVGDKEQIQLVISSDYLTPVTIEGNTEARECTINGVKVENMAGAPFMYTEGYDWETYNKIDILHVNTDVLTKVLNCEIESITMYYFDYETGEKLQNPDIEFYFYRANPAFKAE